MTQGRKEKWEFIRIIDSNNRIDLYKELFKKKVWKHSNILLDEMSFLADGKWKFLELHLTMKKHIN